VNQIEGQSLSPQTTGVPWGTQGYYWDPAKKNPMHKATSYGRMQEQEKRLKEEVKRLLEQVEAADEDEDVRYGRDRRGDELPGGVGATGDPIEADPGS
jgi:hypothetical protein